MILTSLALLQLSSEVEILFTKQTLFGVSFLILAISLKEYKPTLLLNKSITYIGKISYSLYLVHFAVLNYFKHQHILDVFENGLVNFIYKYSLVLICSIVVSGLTYKFIEVPFQLLGKRLTYLLSN